MESSTINFKIDHHKLSDIITYDIFEDKKVYYICTGRLVNEYIFTDDNQASYIMSTIDELTTRYYENSDMLYEDYEEEISGENIENDSGNTQLQEQTIYSEDAILGMKSVLIHYFFSITLIFLKRFGRHMMILHDYSNQPYPRFIWVLEIGTISTFSEQNLQIIDTYKIFLRLI